MLCVECYKQRTLSQCCCCTVCCSSEVHRARSHVDSFAIATAILENSMSCRNDTALPAVVFLQHMLLQRAVQLACIIAACHTLPAPSHTVIADRSAF
jgi:hypothetical protein